MNTDYRTGLSRKEVLYSRNKYGSNKLTHKKKNSFTKLVIESLNDPIIKILLVALAIKIVFLFEDSNIYETLGIAISVFLASFISALSEYGSEKAFEVLNNSNRITKAKVLRDSKKITIDTENIVVGDIVFVECGDRMPCDGLIIDGDIEVNESSLTGESKERHKNKKDNNVYMGSVVVNGNAIVKATLVGDKTYYGKIASSIQEKKLDSPLKIRLRKLSNIITKMGYISAVLVLISYLFNSLIVANNYNFDIILNISELIPHLLYGLTLSVAVIVMSVPEGLPMMITLVLSSNMRKMLKENILVRKLVGIETAGSLNILLTDKTGTLTEGKLKVTSIMDTNFNEYISIDDMNSKIYDLFYLSTVYNNSSFINNGLSEGGNSTDRSILDFIKSDDKNKYNIEKKQYFTSENKYSMIKTNYKNLTFIKGAFEILIEKSDYYLDDSYNKRVLIDKKKYYEKINNYTKEGYRVIALAISEEYSIESLTLIGFVFMRDEIRKEAYKAIDTIKGSGINVVMVTGDSKETAYSVAKKVGILSSKEDLIISSDELAKMSDEEVKQIIPKLKALYRGLPSDKYRLVNLCQENELIVGMTGDGVNDAPALKKSDVGFSMGSGTEVAKETSDIVIIDNNISSISSAILYGRTVFKNIRKFIIFQLSVNLCAVLLSIIGPFVGIIDPITVIQVLWVNIVMDTFAGLAFAYEPPLKEYMLEKPKSKKEPILNKYMINQIIITSIYSTVLCIWFLKSKLISNIYLLEYTDRYLYSAFFGLFIFLSIFNAFNARTYRINILSYISKNKVFIFIIILICFIQIILMYYGGELFRSAGLTIYEFEVMLLLSASIIPVDIIRKLIIKRKGIERNI